MKDPSQHCVIVGGGIVGILASILLAERFKNVTVIERDNHLGGLLDSVSDSQGHYYDYGTHIPSLTGKPDLDHLLFGSEGEMDREWIRIPALQTQSYFSGVWNRTSGLLDARALAPDVYQRGLHEFLHLPETEERSGENLEEHILRKFGRTFTDEIYRPVVRKLFGRELSALEPRSLDIFVLNRLVMLTPEITNRLKMSPYFDEKIGFHTPKPAVHYYPRNPKGSGAWIEALVNKAEAKGVVLKTKTFVEKIGVDEAGVRTITINGMGQMPCDLLVWTIAPALALKAAGLPVPTTAPTLLTTTLVHLTVDKPFLIDKAMYVWCFDPAFKTFRVTLYPNLNPDKGKNAFSLTAEILSDIKDAQALNEEGIIDELRRMEIIRPGSQTVGRLKQVLPNTFPVPDVGFTERTIQAYDHVTQKMPNILLLGRATGKSWFMTDLLKQTFDTLSHDFNIMSMKGV